MATLPQQGKLEVPIQWSTDTQKTEMIAAGYRATVTLGWRSWTDSATLQWNVLTPAQCKSMLDQFRETNFNGIFDYTCNINGPIRIQLTGPAMFTEDHGSKLVSLSVSVRRIS